MCGRFVSASPPDQIASYFDAEEPEAVLPPSYNVATTKDVYAVLSDGGVRHVDAFHWGLIPLWAKEAQIGSTIINSRARSEEHTSKLPAIRRNSFTVLCSNHT